MKRLFDSNVTKLRICQNQNSDSWQPFVYSYLHSPVRETVLVMARSSIDVWNRVVVAVLLYILRNVYPKNQSTHSSERKL